MRPLVRRLSLVWLCPLLCLQGQPPPTAGPVTSSLTRPPNATLVVPQQVPTLPPAISQRLASDLPRLQPTVRAWIDDQVRRQRSLPAPDLEALRAATRTRFAPPPKTPANPATSLPGARVAVGKTTPVAATAPANAPPPVNLGAMDIDALCQIVMAQCAKDTEVDLRAMLNELQNSQKVKAELRALLGDIHKELELSRPASTPCASPNCRSFEGRLRTLAAKLPPKARLAIQPIGTLGDLSRAEASLKGSLDSLSEMGEMEALRLQMAMDRMSKLMSTLSNLMKKASETSAGIIANLK